MTEQDKLLRLLDKMSYLDEIISYFRDSRDPLILRLLLEDPEYSDILISKFFYTDKQSLLKDVEDFRLLDEHIHRVTSSLNYWFNCMRHSSMHAVEKIRFLYVYSGRCVCHLGDEQLALQAGDTCIVPAGMPFSHEGLGEQTRLIHLLIAPAYLQRTLIHKLPHTGAIPTGFFRAILDPEEMHVQVVHGAGGGQSGHFLLWALEEDRQKRMYYREPLESYLVLFITELLRAAAAIAQRDRFSRSSEDKRMMDIRRYVETNSGDVTLSGTAEHFHFTPSYLSQFVRRATGKTFTQLVQDNRLREAVRLLLHTTMSITEIVSLCGYQNTSYFYRLFTQHYGCTPSEYRQKNYGFEDGTAITDNTLPPNEV